MSHAPSPHRPVFKTFRISPPVQREMDAQIALIAKGEKSAPEPIAVIITPSESTERPEDGVGPSKEHIRAFLTQQHYDVRESDFFVFARLLPADITAIAAKVEWVAQIWKDEICHAHVLTSLDTVKATAVWRTYEARGKGITWAVMDTGINAAHPHFAALGTVDLQLSRNFSNTTSLDDRNGHGTHVAGIIGGAAPPRETPYKAGKYVEGQDECTLVDLPGNPSGVAPLARLLNIKVLDDDGTGSASTAIQGLEYVRKLNQSSRWIKVDGVNLSLGYPFDPKWYGCGHSPLCEEVTRAVRSGLVVVISCGNAGYGTTTLESGQDVPVPIGLSITDPANTEEAIAVGSVHKSAPHTYGVSYFSSKGPTGDGRQKPDIVAPGEKVISCAGPNDHGCEYEERSGTSMAAPHVSGAIAVFLSAHPEFRGNPHKLKEIFLKNAIDLGRDRAFQGAGLLDLMRAIGSV